MMKASAATVISASPIPISAWTNNMAGTTMSEAGCAAQPQFERGGQGGGHHRQPGRESRHPQPDPISAIRNQPVQAVTNRSSQDAHVKDIGAHRQQTAILEQQSLHGDNRRHDHHRRPGTEDDGCQRSARAGGPRCRLPPGS